MEPIRNPWRKPSGTGIQQAAYIAKHLDKIPHEKYVEPFLGRGYVFRAKNPSEREILNDLDCSRVSLAKSDACSTKSQEKCQRIKKSQVSCGQDWKRFLRHDSKDTLFFFDPPWEGVKGFKMLYNKKNAVPLQQVIDKSKKLKGSVAIYYRNRPEFRKQLCKKPFKCEKIPSHIFADRFNNILAVKKSSRRSKR